MPISLALKSEIEHTFQIAPMRSTQDELVFVCPECGDTSGNRAVNLRTGLTSCWRCGKGKSGKGNFLAWAKANGYRFTNNLDSTGVPVEDFLVEPESIASKVPYVKEIDLPRGFIPLRDEPDSGYAKLIGKMAVRKRLTLKDFIAAGAGFTRDDNLWEPFCIFPVQELRKTVYYQGRTYTDIEGQTTKKFPSRREVPHGASCWLYNYDDFYDRRVPTVIVVESILNVLSLKKKLRQLNVKDVVPLCVFKHNISTVQATKLFSCKWLKEVCMMFDHDAIAATWNQMNSLASRTKVTIAEMPFLDGNKKLDPNDDVDAAWEAFENRKRHTAGEALEHMLSISRSAVDLSRITRSKCIQ